MRAPEANPATAARGSRRVTLSSFASAVAAASPAFLTAAVAVQIGQEIDLGTTGLGLAVAAFFVTSSLSSAALGRVVQQVGWPTGLRVAGMVTALALLALWLWVDTYGGLLVCLAIAGVGNAMAQPAASLAIVSSIPERRQALIFSIKQCAVPSSSLLGGALVPILAVPFGWQWAFAVGFGVTLGALALVPRSRWPARRRGVATSMRGSRLGLVLMATGAGLGAGITNALVTFLVVSAVAVGLSEGIAGAVLAAASVFTLAVRLALGWLLDRRGASGIRYVAALLAAGSLGYLLIALGGVPGFLAGTFIAFGAGWGWPGAYNFAVADRHRGAAATATGIAQTGVYLGAAAGPFAFGAFASAVSLQAAWAALGLASLVAALLIVFGGTSGSAQSRIELAPEA